MLKIMTSGLNHLKRWVQALQFDTGVLCCEAPIGFCVAGVALLKSGADLSLKVWLIFDAPVKALPGQDSQFRFGHVKPTAMFGRIAPLEPLDKTAGLFRLKGFVEGGGGVGAQIILHPGRSFRPLQSERHLSF